MEITQQHRAFFDTFGFLVFPGLVRPQLDGIVDSFTRLLAAAGKHDGAHRTITGTDTSPGLCTLLENPAVLAVLNGLLGAEFNYLGGDANYYVGDTNWHSDGWHEIGLFAKMAFYLDPVDAKTGCLRVIPGSHLPGSPWRAMVSRVGDAQNQLGVPGCAVPAYPLVSQPGDVVVFNHNLQHASYGGSSSRRMFTLNLSRRAQTPEEVADLRGYINSHSRFWIDHMHSDYLRANAPDATRAHLAQVMENETELPALSRKARESMSERARG